MTYKKARAALNLACLLALCVVVPSCGGSGPSDPPTANDVTYNIDLRYFGDPAPSAEIRAAFTLAQQRIEKIITAGVPAVSLNNSDLRPDSVCGIPGTVLNEQVDDLIIYATVKTIDGPGRVQASSGPCLIRSSTKLPIVGVMEMDVDDLNQLGTSGRINAVVLHEMLHVLGFGTVWDSATKKLLLAEGRSDPRFIGAGAIQACNAITTAANCSPGVAVENCVGIAQCGTGTRDSHWRELTFRDELMTGFLSQGTAPMPLSAMSIRSLEDLGYSVNVSQADPYIASLMAITAGDAAPAAPVAWEKIRTTPRVVPSR